MRSIRDRGASSRAAELGIGMARPHSRARQRGQPSVAFSSLRQPNAFGTRSGGGSYTAWAGLPTRPTVTLFRRSLHCVEAPELCLML